MTLVELRDVSYRHGSFVALRPLSLTVEEGSTVAVVGPNGSGKSTLLMLLSQIWRPCAGEVVFRGQLVRTRADRLAVRRQSAMVFDEPLLFAGSVRHNVGAGLAFRRVPRAERASRVQECLERFRIAHLGERDACELSLGEAQRVSLARAFAVQPALLLLDEPFHALDPVSRGALLSDLADNLRSSHITTVFTTHHLDEVRLLADRLAVLRAGRLAQVDKPAEVFARPSDPEVAAFVGMENLIAARVVEVARDHVVVEARGLRIRVAGAARLAEELVLGLRPEHVTLHPGGLPDAGGDNLLAGKVTALHPAGACTRVSLDVGFDLTALVMERDPGADKLRVGADVTARFSLRAVHVLRGAG